MSFTGERFPTVAQFDRVPYRPAAPIAADSFTQAEAEALARGALLFEQEAGASWYLAAALPYYDEHQQLAGPQRSPAHRFLRSKRWSGSRPKTADRPGRTG